MFPAARSVKQSLPGLLSPIRGVFAVRDRLQVFRGKARTIKVDSGISILTVFTLPSHLTLEERELGA